MMATLSNPFLALNLGVVLWGAGATGAQRGVFQFILTAGIFLFTLVTGLTLLFVQAYRSKKDGNGESVTSSSPLLQVLWTGILVIFVGSIFFFGLRGFLEKEISPRNTYDIEVVGRNWYWEFIYPNGYSGPALHVPVNEAVRLLYRSEDVNHSFHIPAFHSTKAILPGRSTESWFTATQSGVYPAYCSEFCGTGHSNMITAVVVHDPGEFEKWMGSVGDPYADMPPAEAGKKIIADKGCIACHSVDGLRLVGPSFKGIYGTQELMSDGSVIQVDESYLKESIEDPLAMVVDGFEPTMPPYKGTITDAELDFIVEFIKSLAE